MKKFIIEKSFWDVFPKASIAVVSVNNVNNSSQNSQQYRELLDKSIIQAKTFLTNEIFSENEVVQKWRQAYQQFKTKKGARSSIESLLKRVENQHPLSNINPLVDLYNCVSLMFAVPCGGEDIDKIKGDMLLTKANGTEHFITLGSEVSEPPYAEEIIYKDSEGAICRCWNWRESMRTMLTEETKNAVFILEEINGDNTNLENAAKKLVALVEEYLNATAHYEILNIDHPSSAIES